MWNLKKKKTQVNLFIKQRPKDIENKFMVTKGKRWGRDKLGGWD